MEIIEFNPFEMKDAIENGTLISNKGFHGTVFLHNNKLIKLHKRLYDDLKVNSRNLSQRRFDDIYRFDKRPFVNPDQIQYLSSIQPNIHLTDFDKGIVLVKDQVCGVILAEHLDYKDLTDIDNNDPKTLLIILKNILNALRELELNKISHLDLAMAEKGCKPTLNILYKGSDIKLCDLSGKFITYKENFDRKGMYLEYAQVINIILNKLINFNEKYKYLFNELNLNELVNYENSLEAINVIERKIK